MEEFKRFKGYRSDFLGTDFRVPLPRLSKEMKTIVAPVKGTRNNVLRYQNFSLVQNSKRRFPFFTAANINGKLFKKLPRFDSWRLEPRIDSNHQWGSELYAAEKSDFDRGHMTKREDVQWGRTKAHAKNGADSTFYYTNAVPQVPKLNQQLWRGLEDYILKSETVAEGFKINLFTGPVLSDKDPIFVTKVEGEEIRIPTLFWKVIYFTKSDGRLYRVGFLMGQEELLEQDEIVFPKIRERGVALDEEEQLFMEFKHADIFQVNISTIQKLTKLKFKAAKETYKDDRPITLIRTKVQGRGISEEEAEEEAIIEGLIL